MRAIMSVLPPAASGTTTVTGRFGQSPACDGAQATQATSKDARRRNVSMPRGSAMTLPMTAGPRPRKLHSNHALASLTGRTRSYRMAGWIQCRAVSTGQAAMNETSDLAANYRGVFDGRMGFGRSPAVIVVDFIRAY